MVTLNQSQTFLCVVQLSFSSLQLPVSSPWFVFFFQIANTYVVADLQVKWKDREVSITDLGDCKRKHRESLRFAREFSWFVFSPFPTIFSDRRGSVSFVSFPRVKSFASARRREVDSIQIQNCSTRFTRRLYACFSAKNFQSHRAGIYPREKSAFSIKFVRNGAPSCGVSRPMHSKSLDTCGQAAPKTAVLYLLSGNRGPGQRRRGWKRR